MAIFGFFIRQEALDIHQIQTRPGLNGQVHASFPNPLQSLLPRAQVPRPLQEETGQGTAQAQAAFEVRLPMSDPETRKPVEPD